MHYFLILQLKEWHWLSDLTQKRKVVSDYGKREIMFYANNRVSDQSAHLHIVIKSFTVSQYILQ